MLTLRDLGGPDAREVLELHSAAVHGLAADDYDRATLEAWAPLRIDDELVAFFRRNPDAERRIVAERGGRIVGFGALVIPGRELRACYVHPSAARQGVGRALVERLEAIARSEAVPSLWLDASLGAVPFYTRLGYRNAGSGTHQLHRSGREIPMACVRMTRNLCNQRP